MTEIDPSLQKHLEYNCYLKNTYSVDKSKNRLLQNDIQSIYNINISLFIIYYLILIIYIVFDFKTIFFGNLSAFRLLQHRFSSILDPNMDARTIIIS